MKLQGSRLLRRFSAAVERSPNASAVVAAGVHYSRARLDEDSRLVADSLQTRVSSDDGRLRIAVCLDKGYEHIATVVGCLKAGATYVPLFSGWPTEVKKRMLTVVQPSLVVHEQSTTDLGPYPTCTFAELLRPATTTPPVSAAELESRSIAYIMFTSGSTGTPKGVQISYAALEAFVKNLEEMVPLRDDAEQLLNVIELSFDVSVADWSYMLLGKGPLHLQSISMNSLALVDYIDKERITYVSSVPGTFTVLLQYRGRFEDAQLATVGVVCCAGSAMFSRVARGLREVVPQARLYNLFGPTEATVYCSGVLVTESDLDADTVHVGRPFADQRYLFDTGSSISDTPGDEAELLIVGTQLMDGYLGDSSGLEAVSWKGESFTAYRSGDLFKESGGKLFFVARKTGFIKMHGYRISPLEVEIAYLAHPEIVECAAVGIPDAQLDNLLVLFFVSKSSTAPSEAELLELGAKSLADYSLPVEFLTVDALPKTTSGKTDYGKLRQLYVIKSQ